MRRDYARYKAKRRPTVKVRWRPMVLLASLFLVLITASLFWANKHHKDAVVAVQTNKPSLLSEVKVFFTHKKKNPLLSTKTQKTVIQSAEDDVHFDFYTELPNIQVTPAIEEDAAPAPPAEHIKPVTKKIDKKTEIAKPAVSAKAIEAKQKQVVLQMGIFSDMASADQLRLSLLLGGFESTIVKTSAHGSYRVQQGPFATLSQAKNAQKKLQRKGIDSEIKNV